MPIYKKVNKNFFKKWSRDMSYVLGFFAADGYITVNRRGGQFWCLEVTDKKIIEQIRVKIDAGHKISFRKRRDGVRISYRLQIGSIEMCNDLRKLGYNQNKTRSLSVPNVPDKYLQDFVRGYFDGDGHVWTGRLHKERKTKTFGIQSVFTSCSKKFLEKIRERLEFFDMKSPEPRRGKGNYYRLTYSILGSLKLYDFMYNDRDTSDLFLKRKRDVFEKYKTLRL